MNGMHEELVRQRQHEYQADAASRRQVARIQAANRWRRAEAWAARRRVRAEHAAQEVGNAAH